MDNWQLTMNNGQWAMNKAIENIPRIFAVIQVAYAGNGVPEIKSVGTQAGSTPARHSRVQNKSLDGSGYGTLGRSDSCRRTKHSEDFCEGSSKTTPVSLPETEDGITCLTGSRLTARNSTCRKRMSFGGNVFQQMSVGLIMLLLQNGNGSFVGVRFPQPCK